MGDYDELCEMYRINPGDPEGLDKILDIFACDNLRPKYRNRKSATGRWVRAPLGRKGDLERWIKCMREKYPSPEEGVVVEQVIQDGETIGYLCKYKDGEPWWERVVWKETPNQQNIEDSDGFDDVAF